MSRSSSRARLAVGCALLATLSGACGVLRTAAETPERMARAVLPGFKETAPPVEDLFLELSRYLDQMVFRVEAASHEFEQAAGTPQAQLEGARLRLESLRQGIRLASGLPFANILDLIALAAVFRWHLEDYEIPEVWGEAARPLQVAGQRVEDDGWELIGRYLEAPQVEEARTVLASWRERNPSIGPEALAEFPSFQALAKGMPTQAGEGSTSLLGMVGLDPLSNLEPAKREIEQTRQLAQRVLYFGQRASQLVAAELEYGLLRVRSSPEARGTLDQTERITASVESFAATAASLPEALQREREALVLDLERTQEPLARLLSETRTTLEAGERMSAELDEALHTLDAFVGRFEKPDEPSPQPPAEESAAKPFDVTEYGQAAEQVGVAASQLTALLTELDRKLPELQRVLDETAARGEATVDRAALRVLQVGGILIAAAALAAWLVRRSGALGSRRREGG